MHEILLFNKTHPDAMKKIEFFWIDSILHEISSFSFFTFFVVSKIIVWSDLVDLSGRFPELWGIEVELEKMLSSFPKVCKPHVQNPISLKVVVEF